MASLMTGYAETGLTTAAFIRRRKSDGYWWSTAGTPAFEAYNASNIANYGIAATEVGSTGIYTATDPAESTEGDCLLVKKAGASLTVSDVATGGRWQADVQEIQSRLPTELGPNGEMVCDLYSIFGSQGAVDPSLLAFLEDYGSGTLDVNVGRKVLGGGSGTITGTGVRAVDASGNAIATASALTTVSTNVDTLLSRITASLFSGITSLAQWLGLMAGKQVGDSTARTEMRATGAGSGTYDETTDSQEAIRDNSPPSATAIADALLGRNLAGGSSTGRTVSQCLASLRNKVAFDVPANGQFTVYAEDDTTPLWTGTYTATAGANPVTAIDPS